MFNNFNTPLLSHSTQKEQCLVSNDRQVIASPYPNNANNNINPQINHKTDNQISHDNQITQMANTINKQTVEINPSTIKVISWNIRGLRNKILDEDTQSFLFKHDIILLTETHNDQHSEEYYNCIPNFIYKDFPRKFKHKNAPNCSGGIGVYIRKDIYPGIELSCKYECVIWLKLKQAYFHLPQDKHIACVYFSPHDSTYIHNTDARTDYFNILSEEISSKSSSVFICGDLNARTGKLSDNIDIVTGSDGPLADIIQPEFTTDIQAMSNLENRYTKDTGINEYGKTLIDMCKYTGIRIMNGRLGNEQDTGDFTCYKSNGGASIVDYLLCRPQDMRHVQSLILHAKRPESDHRPLAFILSIPERERLNKNTNVGHNSITKFKWDSDKIEKYHSNLIGCDFLLDKIKTNVTDSNRSIEDISGDLYNYINTAVAKTFKKSRNQNNTFPKNSWFNEECKVKKRELHDYAKQYNITELVHAEHYRNIEKEYKRIVQKSKRQYEETVRSKLQNCVSTKPSVYWSIWKSLKPKTINNSSLELCDFESYFQQQVSPPDITFFDHSHMTNIKTFVESFDKEIIVDEISHDICNSAITLEEIKLHVRKLKQRKAPGYDGLAAEFFKFAHDDIYSALYIVFNTILDRGEWPQQWAIGLISPVHKKNSINECDNYRKITVMPVLSKILESILNSRLIYKNKVQKMDDPYQFGFMNEAQTTDNIFILNTLIMQQRNRGQPLWVCFIDFTKAFDYVNRHALYYKLIKRGVNGKMLKLLMNMYTKAKCRVKWKNMIGNEIDSNFGVLQGGMMSPRLFTEFLTDLKNYLDNESGVQLGDDLINYILYADDMVLCSHSASGLQKLIDGLYEYCKKWHLIVSLAKTNVMVIGTCQTPRNFTFGNEEIKITNEYKYLGTIISNDSYIFKKNLPNLATKSNNAIFALNSYIRNTLGQLQPNLALKMFDNQISPIMEYASEVWYRNKEVTNLEKVHLSYMKHALKTKMSTSTIALYAELGRFPISMKFKCRVINYWKRIITLDPTHPVRQAYNTLKALHVSGQTNWCSTVKTILSEGNNAQLWHNQVMTNKQYSSFKEQLHQSFMMDCINKINDSTTNPKLRTYKLLKEQFKLESYLTHPTNINHTLALLKFRISAHNLAIETGRYTKPKTPIENRLCIHCTQNEVETEKHFLLNCSLYNNERQNLLESIRHIIPDNQNDNLTFIDIMTNQNTSVTNALGKYIFTCLNKRNHNIITIQ